jgi:hypothetical protein
VHIAPKYARSPSFTTPCHKCPSLINRVIVIVHCQLRSNAEDADVVFYCFIGLSITLLFF